MGEYRTIEPGQQVTVRVPATSANLGPGFDSLGLAVGLHDLLRVTTTVEPGLVINISGDGADGLPRDGSHLAVRVMEEVFATAGFTLPGLVVDATNHIPHGRGLGSSAAAVVSSVLAANALLPVDSRLTDGGILQRCSELEGHPDNVAPALCGSLAISWESEGTFASTRVAVHTGVVPVLAIPAFEVSTESARALLPAAVPHRSAAANAGRTALLVHALTTEPELLLPATEDFLHQQYRAGAMPTSIALVEQLRRRGFAAVVSGAGPSVAVLAAGTRTAAQAAEAIAAITGSDPPWRVLTLDVDAEGARIKGHPG